MLFRSNLIPVIIRYQLGVILFYIIFSCLSSFTEPLNRPLSLSTFLK